MNRDTENLLIAEKAADWLERLEHAGFDERAQFVCWLKESPQHSWEILQITSTDVVLRHLLRDAGIDTSTFLGVPDNVRSMADRRAPQPKDERGAWRTVQWRLLMPARASWKAAAVIAFVALLSLMTVVIYAVSDRSVTTAAGQWHTTRLADGTILRVGPRTQVTVDITDGKRVVHLARGEVMAYVAKDHARPFFIETDLATARAVGTAFAVRHTEPEHVAIFVQEGTVAVDRNSASDARKEATLSSVLATAGYGVFVAKDGRSLASHPVDLRKELAWLDQRLILDQRSTIASGIHELNLRNRRQIKLLDPALGQRTMRGTFAASDPESFARMLEQQLPVSVLEEGDTLVVVPHPTAGPVESGEIEVR